MATLRKPVKGASSQARASYNAITSALKTQARLPSFGPTAKIAKASQAALAQMEQKTSTSSASSNNQARLQQGINTINMGRKLADVMLPFSAVLKYVNPPVYSVLEKQYIAERDAANKIDLAGDATKDLYELTPWEKLGLFRSPEERRVQESVANQAFYGSQIREIQNESNLLRETQIISRETGIPYTQAEQNNGGGILDGFTKAAPWVAVGLIAVLAISASKR